MENNKVNLLPLYLKRMQPKYAQEVLIMDTSCQVKFLFHDQGKCEDKITKSIAITTTSKKMDLYYLCTIHYEKFLEKYQKIEIIDLSKTAKAKTSKPEFLNLFHEPSEKLENEVDNQKEEKEYEL